MVEEFSIAIHGHSAIASHIETKVHKTVVDNAYTAKKLITFFWGILLELLKKKWQLWRVHLRSIR